MKRTILLFASLLLGITMASASETHATHNGTTLVKNNNYRNAQPIVFMERGVEFLIFPDGTFDFNTNNNDAHYGNSRRSSINASYNGPRVSVNYSSRSRGTHISRDRNGTIRSIGDVYLNYDRYGKITRVGSIFMDYRRGRNATLSQVGGLRVNYNHYGEIVNIQGQINRYNNNCNVCGTLSCTMDHNQNNDHNDYERDHDRYNNNDNNYYYKQKGKNKKYKK